MFYRDGRPIRVPYRDAFIKIFSSPGLKRRLFYALPIIMGGSLQPTSLEEDYQ
jgi:hypothetical protein